MLRLRGAAADATQVVEGNASFAATAINFGGAGENTAGAMADAETELAMSGAEPGAGLDLHPASGRLEGSVDTAGFEAFLESDLDFDRSPRSTSVHGAYAGPAGAGAWPLSRILRPLD